MVDFGALLQKIENGQYLSTEEKRELVAELQRREPAMTLEQILKLLTRSKRRTEALQIADEWSEALGVDRSTFEKARKGRALGLKE